MPVALTLFQLNDAHGYLNVHQEAFFGPTGLEYRGGGGGYARIAILLRELREQHPQPQLLGRAFRLEPEPEMPTAHPGPLSENRIGNQFHVPTTARGVSQRYQARTTGLNRPAGTPGWRAPAVRQKAAR